MKRNDKRVSTKNKAPDLPTSWKRRTLTARSGIINIKGARIANSPITCHKITATSTGPNKRNAFHHQNSDLLARPENVAYLEKTVFTASKGPILDIV